MLKKAICFTGLLTTVFAATGQTTFLPLGSDGYYNMDRWETLTGRLSDSINNAAKMESRRNIVHFLEAVGSTPDTGVAEQVQDGKFANGAISEIDRYNMRQMVSESGEWAADEHGEISSKKSIFNSFYKKQYDFVYVKTDNFFLVVNPVINLTATMQQNNPSADPVTGTAIPKTLLLNSHGAELRGWIAKKVGFYSMVTDNQEQFPYYINNYAQRKWEAVPGADYFKRPSSQFGTYDYLQVSGYINTDLVKNHVNASFGYGKHFFGNGISSIFLTDNSSNMPFFRLQTRIWKLNYECLYLELTPQYVKSVDKVMPHKYSTIHYLNVNATHWLNVGLFEAQVFGRTGGYEISYLNPMILSTAMSRYNGAGDKSIIGFDAKAMIAHKFQLYGQFLFNEFRIKELTGGRKWYGNKWAVQMGGKYFNAFGLKNVDLQGEVDAARPYTYSAQDTIANYTNYNQAMADPLGSGYVKLIGQIHYQPIRNLTVTARATFYRRGNDTGAYNYGDNIFKAYPTATTTYGVGMINGTESNCKMLSLNLSYQFRRNMFVDLGGVHRSYQDVNGVYPHSSSTGTSLSALTTTYFYFGIRVNAARRAYDIF